VDVFGCTSCGAAATETVSDGGASIAVVRHQANCPVVGLAGPRALAAATCGATQHTSAGTVWAGHRHALQVWEEQR
jgi:16S rRNA C1402 (ribose-2'-O) methylase RsmI